MREPADIYIRQKKKVLFNCSSLKMIFGEMYSGDGGLDLSRPNEPNNIIVKRFNILNPN